MSELKTIKIKITGLVQGVGFRPFVYRIAIENSILGWVDNRNDGVWIEAEGSTENLANFVESINKKKPLAADIDKMIILDSAKSGFKIFEILKSKNSVNSAEVTQISPDIAFCDNCLIDIQLQPNRIKYPFTNCTNCGPRFSIIEDLPYDREKTTMKHFEMCADCASEYEDVLDRRFHAQPVACNHCGPIYSLTENNKTISDLELILQRVSKLLDDGKIIAIKGLGGFHLMCDALNDKTVKLLRKSKLREGKPFAVMFGNLEKVQEFAEVSEYEKYWLQSWQRPIVLLQSKKNLSPDVTVGFPTVGAMLPYLLFHQLLFEKIKTPAIVLTSGNISDEPIIIDNDVAMKNLSDIYDAILTYNRNIRNRTDDSVMFVTTNKGRLIRRSRGFAPSPLKLNLKTEGIFAAGAELANTFCLGKGNQAIFSQHIGDLKNPETHEFYTETIQKFFHLFRFSPQLTVRDLHPDYLSSQFASKMGVEIMEVQHHHAHIASCMAENALDEKVIGLSFDGTGYGADGNIWGGEFLICDLQNFERYSHFEYIPMPGGDKASKQPWRSAFSYLKAYFGFEETLKQMKFPKNISENDLILLNKIVDQKINCPLSSSAGRLFDAVASVLDLCYIASFHAEAPMRLESVLDKNEIASYDFDFKDTISFEKTFEEILLDKKRGIPVSTISAKFHNMLINSIFAVVKKMRIETGINKILLSGGTFQNKYLLEKSIQILESDNFKVYTQSKIPSNDGGLALGQLAIAAKRRSLCV